MPSIKNSWLIFNICHVHIHASWSCVDSHADVNANEAERKEREHETETQKSAYLIAEAPWLEFCHATIYKLKWIRSSAPWPPLKTLHCWWAMIASAIDWRSISMANPVSSLGGHLKQFRHIERLIRATELPLGPTQGKEKCEVWRNRSLQLRGGSISNLNANGFFKSLAAL